MRAGAERAVIEEDDRRVEGPHASRIAGDGGTGIVRGELRVYTAGAYRAVFGLCLAVAVGAVALAACVTETRCRYVWTSG